MDAPCPECDVVAGRRSPPGGVLLRADGLVLHAIEGPTPVRGWLVIAPERHVRAVHDLDEASFLAVARLARRVLDAQREVLGAEHGYVAAFGEALHHAHLHVIPRYADTPAAARGPRVFQTAAADAVPDAAVIDAAHALAAHLHGPR